MNFTVQTSKREELIDITEEIKNSIPKGKGIVQIFIPHTTAAVTINENADPNLPKDISNFLNSIVPKGKWKHDEIDGNADAHIKSSLIGSSVFVPFENGKLLLGTYQNIFLCEFDGSRKRNVLVNFLEG